MSIKKYTDGESEYIRLIDAKLSLGLFSSEEKDKWEACKRSLKLLETKKHSIYLIKDTAAAVSNFSNMITDGLLHSFHEHIVSLIRDNSEPRCQLYQWINCTTYRRRDISQLRQVPDDDYDDVELG